MRVRALVPLPAAPFPPCTPSSRKCYILVATFVMLNLFIGVVCIAMEESHTEIKEEVLMEAKVNAQVKKHNITGKQFRKITEAFRLIDTNGCGSIDAQELSEAFTVADIWIR